MVLEPLPRGRAIPPLYFVLVFLLLLFF